LLLQYFIRRHIVDGQLSRRFLSRRRASSAAAIAGFAPPASAAIAQRAALSPSCRHSQPAIRRAAAFLRVFAATLPCRTLSCCAAFIVLFLDIFAADD
jgi:hypothetical protein